VANFQSSSPRPSDGRVTILAYALGEESFLDSNGNNVFDAGEDYQDLGDVFLDRVLNGTYNALEDQFISLGISGTDPCRVATSLLLQLTPASPSRAKSETGASLSTCVSGWGRAYVRKSIETVLSTSEARPVWGPLWPRGAYVSSPNVCPAGLSLLTGYGEDDSPKRVTFYPFGNNAVAISNLGKIGVINFALADANPIDPFGTDKRAGAYNPMPAGSTLELATTDGMAVAIAGGSPVPSTSTPSGVAISYAFDEAATEGVVTVTVITPSGFKSSFSQRLVRGAPTGTFVTCP
jgi:hypothetical protein